LLFLPALGFLLLQFALEGVDLSLVLLDKQLLLVPLFCEKVKHVLEGIRFHNSLD